MGSEFDRAFQASAKETLLRVFGVAVIYNPYGGSSINVTAVFERTADTVEYEGAESVVSRATLTVKATDIPGVDMRDTVTIDGVTWAVLSTESRVGGMITIELYNRVPRTRGTARMQ
jgi:hypothetical protein